MRRSVLALLVLLTAALAFGCSSPADSDPALDPIFVLLCDDIDPEEPPHPCCTGFAMAGQVVTANHCVPEDYIRVVSRQKWLHTASDSDVGRVVARDEARDIAWLSAPVDDQLERGAPIAAGAAVSAITVSGVKPGTAIEQAGVSWLSNVDTMIGDSGAAIVDAHGDAIGVLSSCLVALGDRQCGPNTGIFAELP